MSSNPLRTVAAPVFRVVLALLMLASVLPAVSMVSAAANQADANATAAINGSENGNASINAETAAQAKELGTAVGGFWKIAWSKSWPYLKGVMINFWLQIKHGFALVTAAFTQIDKSVNVNADAHVPIANVNGSFEVQ